MSDFQQPQPPPPANPYDSPESVRPGMSSGTKVLLGVGIGCGVLMLLCCGGFGIFALYFGRSFQSAASEDPATIRRVTEGIVTIEIPESIEPKFAIDWTIPFVNQSIQMAVYGEEKSHSAVILFQADESLGSTEQMKEQLRTTFRDVGQQEFEEVKLEEPEEFNTKINGEDAQFTYGQGTRKARGEKVWQAAGAFEGQGGPALLFVQLSAEEYDKDQLMAILKSMK